MSHLGKDLIKYVGWLFGVLVVAFTSLQTWALIHEVSGSPIVATIGLVMFEGGMLYWWFVFQHRADGLQQMALSILVASACLILVGVASAAELGAMSIEIDSRLPSRLIIVAVLMHLVAKFIFPLISPSTRLEIQKRVMEGKIQGLAFQKFDEKIEKIASAVADGMAEQWRDGLRTQITNQFAAAVATQAEPTPPMLPAPIAPAMGFNTQTEADSVTSSEVVSQPKFRPTD